MNAVPVLFADDDETDIFFMKRALAKVGLSHPVEYVPDGLAAIESLALGRTRPEGRLPGLVILDLKMPRRNGLQVLEWMRNEPVIRAIPALMLSSSSAQADIENAYEAGASGYLIKASSSEGRLEAAAFIKAWLRLVQPPLAASESYKAALTFRAVNRNGAMLSS